MPLHVYDVCRVMVTDSFSPRIELLVEFVDGVTRLELMKKADELKVVVVSSGGAPTPAGTSVFTKHNWDMGMGYLWLNGWGIYHLMGGAFMA